MEIMRPPTLRQSSILIIYIRSLKVKSFLLFQTITMENLTLSSTIYDGYNNDTLVLIEPVAEVDQWVPEGNLSRREALEIVVEDMLDGWRYQVSFVWVGVVENFHKYIVWPRSTSGEHSDLWTVLCRP